MTTFPDFFERLAIPESGLGSSAFEADWANASNDVFTPPSIEVTYDPHNRAPREFPVDTKQRGAYQESAGHRPDIIARYVPWHLHPYEWGIYFHETAFWDYVHDVHAHVRRAIPSRGPQLRTVARIAFETVLEHEYTHFDGEILATQLEAVNNRSLYVSYLSNDYRAHNGFGSPLEEALATSREMQLARNARIPAVVVQALESSADSAPAGYSDWRAVFEPRDQETAIARLQAILSRQTVLAPFALGSSPEERAQVLVRWVPDDPDHPLLPPGVSKVTGVTTIRQLEAWLPRVGLESRDRKSGGDHKDIWDLQADRRVSGYDSCGGRKSKELYDPQPSRIARDLGFPSRAKFIEAVRTMGARPGHQLAAPE